MDKDSRTRKWQITINNPADKGFSHDKIVEILSGMKSLVYYCVSDEIGEAGTYHTHIFLAAANAVRFSTIKKNFEGGHFEMCQGSAAQNRDYVFKEGKWRNSEKGTTNLSDTHIEWGELPVERQGKRNDLDDLYDMIQSGFDVPTILDINPQYILQIDKLERARSMFLHSKYKDDKRDVSVTYIYGRTGTGKTRSVMDAYGYSNVYRVTDYAHPFDSYDCEDVIIFEEFRSSLPLGCMLNYLDIYPIKLPARYANKQACFTKIFIISNWELERQYQELQVTDKESYNAFLRRIDYVDIFFPLNQYRFSREQYFSGFVPAVYTSFDELENIIHH